MKLVLYDRTRDPRRLKSFGYACLKLWMLIWVNVGLILSMMGLVVVISWCSQELTSLRATYTVAPTLWAWLNHDAGIYLMTQVVSIFPVFFLLSALGLGGYTAWRVTRWSPGLEQPLDPREHAADDER